MIWLNKKISSNRKKECLKTMGLLLIFTMILYLLLIEYTFFFSGMAFLLLIGGVSIYFYNCFELSIIPKILNLIALSIVIVDIILLLMLMLSYT